MHHRPISSNLLAVLSLALLSQMALSIWLWLPFGRTFPLLSFFDFAILESAELQFFLFTTLVLSLLGLLFFPRRWVVLAAIVALFFSFFQDLMRVQTWSYQYFLMLIACWAGWKKAPDVALMTLRWVVIFIYFWGGVQKINPHFEAEAFPWFVSAFRYTKPLAEFSNLGYSIAVGEALLGVGLLWKPSRRWTVLLITLFHLLILISISPLGHDWNSVVYPWNVAMTAFVWLLFWDKKNIYLFDYQLIRRFIPFWLIVLLMGFCPILDFFHRFPEPMSMTMYNAATDELNVRLIPEDTVCFDRKVREEISLSDFSGVLSLDDWSMKELNVPTYNLPFFPQKIGRKVCKCLTDKDLGGIEVVRIRRWTRKNYLKIKTFSCQELKK